MTITEEIKKEIESLVYDQKSFIVENSTNDFYFFTNGYTLFVEKLDHNLDTLETIKHKRIWKCADITFLNEFIVNM